MTNETKTKTTTANKQTNNKQTNKENNKQNTLLIVYISKQFIACRREVVPIVQKSLQIVRDAQVASEVGFEVQINRVLGNENALVNLAVSKKAKLQGKKHNLCFFKKQKNLA
jgi:hypothetical protein